MTIITKASAKAYFVTGAFPTQSQFGDTIDSYLGLAEGSNQTIGGDVTVSGATILRSGVTVSGNSNFPNNITVSGATGLYGDITLGVSAKSTLQTALGLSKYNYYQFNDSTDISLSATPTQANVGSPQTINIPLHGKIMFDFTGELISVGATAYLCLGMRIGSTNYWPSWIYGSTTDYMIAAQTNGAGTDVFKGFGPGQALNVAFGVSGLSIDANSIPTGNQSVQIIASSIGGATLTIKGTAVQTIIGLTTIST